MRASHYLSEAYFDYYQYQVPRLRNKFMHTGYDEDFQIKSYDLLTDLEHLLRTFYELDNPSVILKRLHTRKDPRDFSTFKEFASYFESVDKLSDKNKAEMSASVLAFENEFLNVSCDPASAIAEVAEQLPLKIAKFIKQLEYYLQSENFPSQFLILNKKDFRNRFKNESFRSGFKNAVFYNAIDFENLRSLGVFVNGADKYLRSLDPEIKKTLAKLKSDNETFFSNINEAYSLAVPNHTA